MALFLKCYTRHSIIRFPEDVKLAGCEKGIKLIVRSWPGLSSSSCRLSLFLPSPHPLQFKQKHHWKLWRSYSLSVSFSIGSLSVSVEAATGVSYFQLSFSVCNKRKRKHVHAGYVCVKAKPKKDGQRSC